MTEPKNEPGSTSARPEQSPDDPQKGSGYSDTEKLVAAAAAYKAPLASGLAASYLLSKETDPEKRRQLETFRKYSLAWLAVGVAVAIVGVIVIVSFASSHGLGGGSACRGGIDTMDPEGTTYVSDGANHWTATYPCVEGGQTTVPVPARSVPGGGDFT